MKVEEFIRTMGSFVGIIEYPPSSNRTAIGVEFGWNGVAWCAETVSVACKRNGFPLHEAAVINIEKHAKAGDWGMRWSSVPIRGAAACFDFGGRGNPAQMHTGIVSDVLSATRFRNIEGNYQNRCARVLRDTKFVRGFAMFPFESEEVMPEMNLVLPPGVAMISHLIHPLTGGEAILLSDGGVLCFDCDFNGNVVGKSYMKPDHSPRKLALNPNFTPENGKPWYIIGDQHDHWYGHDGF